MQKMFTQMEGPVKGKAFSIEVMAVLGIRILKPRHSNLIWHLWACIQMKLGKCQLKHQPISFWCFWGKKSVSFHCRWESKMIVKGASRRVIIIWWVWRHCVLSGGNVQLLTFCHKRTLKICCPRFFRFQLLCSALVVVSVMVICHWFCLEFWPKKSFYFTSMAWSLAQTLIISTICGSAYHIFLVITISKFDLSTSWVWGTSDVWEQTWKSILKTDYVELNTFQVWFATNKGDLYFAHLHLCHHFVSIHYFSLNNFPVKFQ